MTSPTKSLNASRYDTDKAQHDQYLQNYEEHFSALANRDIRLLELGVFHGGSLLLWRDYFEQGIIAGLDLNPLEIDDPSNRIRIYQGPQQDTALLDRIARECAPDGFDIIIDDCSHVGEMARISFWHLFENHLKAGGLYVIEDWGTGYWDSWPDGVRYREKARRFSPRRHRLSRAATRLNNSKAAQDVSLVKTIASRMKRMLQRNRFATHDFGMVGFVKELIDELGMSDISDPTRGNGSRHRESRFREIKISPSHLFVTKA